MHERITKAQGHLMSAIESHRQAANVNSESEVNVSKS